MVNDKGELVGLMTRASVKTKKLLPPGAPSLDKKGRLLCGAAIGTRPADKDRAKALVAEGLDMVILDSSQGDSVYQIEMIKWLKENLPELDVIGGNVVTQVQAKRLLEAGADGLRVGMGSGSICTTQEVCAVGRGQATAVYKCANLASQLAFPSSPTEASRTLATSPRRSPWERPWRCAAPCSPVPPRLPANISTTTVCA